ncbi:DUF5808 domain-containing protein [Streptacidiphilus sp. P02-A3a]|uniref:DUF5808 domain-containing protein n=1 Tax=Streptacidiphilus sp. P02-A3a TaxID=2704468 RepID=UPI001CDB94C3|nr:DUF5808 domain-containing protein [Streptacidiphilus sp. P02-A3a]
MSKNTLVLAAVCGWAALAVVKEARQPKEDRTGRGRVLGLPYDFRKPAADRVRREYWDPDNDSLLTPHAFGVGYGVNLARVVRPARDAVAAVRARRRGPDGGWRQR